MDLKRVTPNHLLWVDLEMTGLDAAIDRIVEVGAIVTDWQFKELDSWETGIAHDTAEVAELMARSPFYDTHPELKRDLLGSVKTGLPEKEVEEKLLALVDKHFTPGEPVLLAGNSIHTDRQFIRHWWPQLEERLHYRMLDVSAWKVVMIGRYDLEYKKKEAHRALGDIRESIAELEYYLQVLPSLLEKEGKAS